MTLKKTTTRLLAALMTVIVLLSGGIMQVMAEDNAAEFPPKKTIAVIIQNTDDAVMSMVKKLLDSAAEALNVELLYKTGDLDGGAQIQAVENVIAAGVDGIMIWPLADTIVPKIQQMCGDAKIPFVHMFRGILDEDIAALTKQNPYFLGYTTENEADASVKLTEILAANGNQNVCLVYFPPGDSTGVIRYNTITETLAKEGINVLSECVLSYTSRPQTQVIDATNNFLATYPEMDSIFLLVGITGLLDGVRSVVESEDVLGKVNVVSFDHPATGIEEMFASGAFIGMASGGYVDPLFSFIILYNYLQGTPLSDEPIELFMDYVIVTSYDEAVSFAKYYNSDFLVYTQEEIKMMTKYYNPDFTLEDLQQIVLDYSIQDVISRFE